MNMMQNMLRAEAGPENPSPTGFHLMAKPVGPDCNLGCDYCFYREKTAYFPAGKPLRMSDEVLEAYIRDSIRSQLGPHIVFEWQGGEPTLAGLDFFRKALSFQKKYSDGRSIGNSLQTNGTLIDEAWCRFLSENHFLVGLSIDGPEWLHDVFRKDACGGPTFGKVFKALGMLRKHGVEVNVLVAVNRSNVCHPLELYCFFKEAGVRYLQFIPVVEREPDTRDRESGLHLAGPPSHDSRNTQAVMMPWSVEPELYGEFLIRIFDEWVTRDVGDVFVMNFEWTLGAWAGERPGMCHVGSRCGRNLILEHTGDVFACDHFMYPAYRLGHILEKKLTEIVQSGQVLSFGMAKEKTLPKYCRDCAVLFACHGGCPKHRFVLSPDNEPGLNYLCLGFKNFFHHVRPAMEQMLGLISRGQPVRNMMNMAAMPGG